MALTRWNPTNELMSAWNDFDRLFNRLTRNVDTEDTETSVGNWRPAVDITEREKDYVVTAELPGIDEDDISISIKDNVLTLKGEKKFEKEDSDENRHYRERVYGSFQRMIRLDSDIDSDNVKADYENGVLTITMPKTKETMHKQIPVNFKK
ncbi:MAG: Hsp20/alpha crystallin family protein [Candidatus Marinimicrobia bacterium]|nr:Hsp20/alpha crystallin family protein [Candidatus Neomarinimicrobiota bacterium]MCF7827740.1 Hsp20/alpha crystallin family protein [Candidatus Neomarinimicrobiota bacterium]MCF7881460.1 Hsp20/alpha crystallin family protein [Candidatus Neomarinimicrobiota bacterium]